MDHQKTTLSSPHILFFPLPFQGPVNCMLKLAEIFCLYDFHVTFLNTDYIHSRLISHSDVEHRFKKYEKFRFATVPDGLPEENPRTGDQLLTLLDSMEIVSKPIFEEMVKSGGFGERKLSCVIADGAFIYAVDVAAEAKVPILYFDTLSPCGLWSILSVGKLVEAGEIPFQDDDMDAPIKGIPGMESFLRRRDLPSFFRVNNLHDPIIQRALEEEPQIRKSNGLIFNSFEDLEAPILSHLRNLVPKLYAIGPLHLHLKIRLSESKSPSTHQDSSSSNSIWEEDASCMTWLNQQPLKSVVYVSIGSLAVMTKDQLIEIWYGLINSNFKFLWVQRPGSINYEFQEIPDELVQGTKERGFIVKWAPQELVLAHPSIGGFLTHSGWNSTMESIVEEVPMICWPYYADQQVNSRFVGEVWKIGLDLKDRCDRGCFEKMIREVMEGRKDEFLGNVGQIGKLAKLSVGKNGSSYNDLNRLIEDIRLGNIGVSN